MVKIYTKPGCIQCKMTKRKFDELKIPYIEINVIEDQNALEYLKNQGLQSLPVVETSNDTWTGFRPNMIETLATNL